MQKNYGVKFLSFGASLPSLCVKNTDLEKLFETSDEWIYQRTGIKERRIINENESGLSLSVSAATEALNKANLPPADLDLIIVCTSTPDKLYPSMSCMLQGKIGATSAVGFDLSAACSGFVFGIVTAAQFIYTGVYKSILVVGVDIHSRFIDWGERSVAILFGDGAGALVMQRCLAKDDELLDYDIHSQADNKLDLVLDNKNVSFTNFKNKCDPNFTCMNGREIYQFAIKVVPDVINYLLDKTHLNVSKLDYLVMHQANLRIIDYIANKLGFNDSQIITNIEKVGNTSAASIPIAIVDALDKNRIITPCKMLLVGFGAGLTWGGVVINLKSKLCNA